MILRSQTLLGSKITENTIPQLNASPSIVKVCGESNGKMTTLKLSQDVLSKHILCLGATGSGKTNLLLNIVPQLKQSLHENDVLLIFDSKYDFRHLQTPDDYVISNNLNYSDHAFPIWNIFMDVVADGWDKETVILNASEISSVIFSDSIKESSQPFFPKAASEIFSAVLAGMAIMGKDDTRFRVKYLNNKTLIEYLRKLDAKKLSEFVKYIPSLSGVVKYVGTGKSDQALGVFAELENVVAPLFTRSFGKDGRFSIRKAVRKRGGKTIFLEYNPSCGINTTMYRVLVDLFLKESLCPDHKKGKVYLVADELKLLPSLNYFETALNFGRSLGLSIICGLQSIEQLYEAYGEYGGNNIASAFQTSFCFQTNNESSRNYVKGLHGKNYSNIQYIDSLGKTKQDTLEGHVVEDWNITMLRTGEAIVSLSGEQPFIFRPKQYSLNS